jgi:putative peptidoglycan lipid II flippase
MSEPAISISNFPSVEARPRSKPAVAKSFVSHAKLISALTLLSRVTGLLRESVVARCFGAGVVSSAFTVAFKVPNLFRKLLGEGALSAAFIPLYAQALKTGDEAEANRFAAASVNLLAMILVALTIIGEIALGFTVVAVQLRPENLLVVKLTAIMLPYVVLVCGTAFLGGILQVHKRFGLPAFAPVLLNIIHMAVIIIGARILMLARASEADKILIQTRLAYWLAGFVLVAGVLQIAMLLPALRAVGFRPMWVGNIWTSAVKKMLNLSIPVALSAGVLQLSVVVDTGITMLLTRSEDSSQRMHLFGHAINYPMAIGAVARLNWAQLLYQFPLGVFAIAVATAIFPGLSADVVDKDKQKFKNVLRHGINLTLLEGFAASLGLIIVRYPAIRLLFQRGSFTAADTQWVALSTVFYSAAIWAFSLQQILNRAYYSLHDTVTPLVMAIVTIAVNTVVEIPLSFTRLGEAGMAVGTLASFAAQAIAMLIMLDRRVGGIGLASIFSRTCRMLLACGAMAIACWAVRRLAIYPQKTTHLASLIQLAFLIPAGAIAYGGTCWALRLKLRT